ncbi:PIR Superfamily Protein [Plasmodium ovale curtisi]|uniref:PIR Superfamily Protein n=1 Tax=Plasmodium ovale curtisi TaxID=864141 RepID=A0A1A8X9V2_PLAOA|nr:PIR Superfamily Protein [Plasmodium ovale curtisi]
MSYRLGEEVYCSATEYKTHDDLIKTYRTNNSNNAESCIVGISDSTKRSKILEDFSKLKRYLINYYPSCNKSNETRCCSYINFWLNNELRKNELSEINFDSYKKFINFDQELLQKPMCVYDIYYLNDDRFKKTEELYDLYYQYHVFIAYKDNENSIACVYAKSCVEKYNDMISKYTYYDSGNLLSELESTKNIFEENGLLTIKNCEYPIPPLKPLPPKVNLSLSLSSLVPIPFLAAIVGILPILLLVYKFTPLGPLLHKLIKNNRTILNNFEEENHELMQFIQRNNKNSENRPYTIAYNSADY